MAVNELSAVNNPQNCDLLNRQQRLQIIPPTLPAAAALARGNEHPRSASPDMSRFSESTISTKYTIEGDKKVGNNKNESSYANKPPQTITNRLPANTTGLTNRNATKPVSSGTSNSNAGKTGGAPAAKPISMKAKHIPPPLPYEKEKKTKSESKLDDFFYLGSN
jgi:hypothetical protein